MEYRTLGRTGLRVSALGFGCGNVGGLMVRGSAAERERAVGRALELGINYFDTAPAYGDGVSERHLGETLRALGAKPYVGTKFRVQASERGDVAGAITRSLEASLARLGMERVDLLQLHNLIGPTHPRAIDARDVVDRVMPALDRLRQQGKIGFCGITALGETGAVHAAIDSGALDTAQVCYNLLNPSAGAALPAGYPAQDFGRLLERTRARQVGVIVIRVLAAGALSGLDARHPVAVPEVDPIASGPDYGTDVARARSLEPLVKEGHAGSLVEAALRFAISHDAVGTVLLGYSSQEHLELAAASLAKGPLSRAALDRLGALWGAMQ